HRHFRNRRLIGLRRMGGMDQPHPRRMGTDLALDRPRFRGAEPDGGPFPHRSRGRYNRGGRAVDAAPGTIANDDRLTDKKTWKGRASRPAFLSAHTTV